MQFDRVGLQSLQLGPQPSSLSLLRRLQLPPARPVPARQQRKPLDFLGPRHRQLGFELVRPRRQQLQPVVGSRGDHTETMRCKPGWLWYQLLSARGHELHTWLPALPHVLGLRRLRKSSPPPLAPPSPPRARTCRHRHPVLTLSLCHPVLSLGHSLSTMVEATAALWCTAQPSRRSNGAGPPSPTTTGGSRVCASHSQETQVLSAATLTAVRQRSTQGRVAPAGRCTSLV